MKLMQLVLATGCMLMSCSRAPVESDGARPITSAMAATPGGKLYAALRDKWRAQWWMVFWPTLQKDGSIVCNVGTRVIQEGLRSRFGLPAERPEDEDMFGGFRVIVSGAPGAFHIKFADAAFVGNAGAETKPYFRPLYKPEWGFWDEVRAAFLASLTEYGIQADADPPSASERATGDPFDARHRLMGLADPLNNE